MWLILGVGVVGLLGTLYAFWYVITEEDEWGERLKGIGLLVVWLALAAYVGYAQL